MHLARGAGYIKERGKRALSGSACTRTENTKGIRQLPPKSRFHVLIECYFLKSLSVLKCFMLKHTCFSLCPAEITTVCYLRRNAGVLTHARTDARARASLSGGVQSERRLFSSWISVRLCGNITVIRGSM